MSFKSTLKLESKIFDKNAREQATERVCVRAARSHKDNVRKKMVFGKPTGRTHDREIGGEVGSGSFGVRRHRASRAGERPAVFTGNLANRAVKHRQLSGESAETFIDTEIAPYAEKLIRIKRVIITAEDRRQAQEELNGESEKVIKELL